MSKFESLNKIRYNLSLKGHLGLSNISMIKYYFKTHSDYPC